MRDGVIVVIRAEAAFQRRSMIDHTIKLTQSRNSAKTGSKHNIKHVMMRLHWAEWAESMIRQPIRWFSRGYSTSPDRD